MRMLLIIIFQIFRTLFKLCLPGGIRRIVAEDILIKQQLIVMKRSQSRCPALSPVERILFGFWTDFLKPGRLLKSAILIRPATLLKFHKWLVKRKYSKLFNPNKKAKPGPKGLSQEVINLILEVKAENPSYGCPKIAMIIANTFGIEINKDQVRRILKKHYRPNGPDDCRTGPSWLTFYGDIKDSLWSLDFFRVESISLKSHWVMVIMDQYSRRIVGFEVKAGPLTGDDIAKMFVNLLADMPVPKYLSTDNDPLFNSIIWKLLIKSLGIETLKSIPGKPTSHPFVERLIGSCRREYMDEVFFFNEVDLERKLDSYKKYFNHGRVHASLGGSIPLQKTGDLEIKQANLSNFGWKLFCNGLYKLPIAA
jgi:putative transposase